MTTVLLVIHIMIAIALIAVVLLQRSEGGALGIGGGGGGFMTGRGAGNALTKTTAVLAAAFFATSLTLTILARNTGTPTSIFNQAGTPVQGGGGPLPGLVLPSAPKPPSGAAAPAAPAAPVAPAGPQAPQSKERTADSPEHSARKCADRRALAANDPELAGNSATRGWFGA